MFYIVVIKIGCSNIEWILPNADMYLSYFTGWIHTTDDPVHRLTFLRLHWKAPCETGAFHIILSIWNLFVAGIVQKESYKTMTDALNICTQNVENIHINIFEGK